MIHQANSGGPAGPCNRGLDPPPAGTCSSSAPTTTSARRRCAGWSPRPTYGSDVVLGKAVGVNSRHIYQDIFARTETDIDLFDSPLPRSLANTKLFRRELLERHGIRYREDMPVGSDLPFTLEACYRAAAHLGAGRLRVLLRRAPVRRARNITYLSRHVLRLRTWRR